MEVKNYLARGLILSHQIFNKDFTTMSLFDKLVLTW